MRTLLGVGLVFGLGGCLGSGFAPASGDGAVMNQTDAGVLPPQDGAVASGDGPVNVGKLLCSSDLQITGTFTPGAPQPTDFPGGCWPDGTWTFSAAPFNNNCDPAPVLEQQYQFKVSEDNDFNDTVTYLNDPTNAAVVSHISGGEGGICIGGFLIFSHDGKTTWNLHPALQVGNVFNGMGEYRIYDADQR